MTRRIATLLAACLAAGCASAPDLARFRTVQVAATAGGSEQAREIAFYQGIAVRSGDIIVSEVDAESSLLITLMAARYAPYVHAGVIVVDDGEAYVHHAFATFWPVPGRAPTDTMSGRIRREPLGRYLGKRAVLTIARLPDAEASDRVADYAGQAHRDRLAFDPYFDTANADAVYCTEFVARALAEGGWVSPIPAERNANRSLAVAFDWLSIESPSFWLAGDLIDGLEPVATLSRELTPAQIEARFALKAELHRRFTADQPLGNVFRWGLGGLRLRRQIATLYDDAIAAAEQGFVAREQAALIRARLGAGPPSATRLAERGATAPSLSPR